MAMAGTNLPATSKESSNSTNLLENFRSNLNILIDPNAKEELKLKATQDINEHFEVVVQSNTAFLENSLKVFLKILQDGEPQFITENTTQHIRKLILEMLHRLPVSEILRSYIKSILCSMVHILRKDNEENTLVCLRIIIDILKHYRPPYTPEIQIFLKIAKDIYTDFPKNLSKIFETPLQIRVKDMKELNFEQILSETFISRTIYLEKQTEAGTALQTFNLLPRGAFSLKVLQELPIVVVLTYQIYKNAVHQEVGEFVPLIMNVISLQPPISTHRNLHNYSKDIFVEFIGAQIKTLAFLAFIVRIFQDVIMSHAATVIKGMLNLLQLCPKESPNLRKELLVAARHIFATELKIKFIPIIDRLFDEDLLIGKGATIDALRPLAYSTIADLAHHVRQSLSLDVLEKCTNLFGKTIHDDTLATNIHTMSCKLLLNLIECIRQHSETEPVRAKDLLVVILKIFTLKFKTISEVQLPLIIQKCKTLKNESAGGQNNADSKETVAIDVPISDQATKLCSIGFPPPSTLNIIEYRNLVKTLIAGVKTITWGYMSCKSPASESIHINQVKYIQPQDLLIYTDLVYWALEAIDIYSVNLTGGAMNSNQLKVHPHIARTKEEKEILEHFAGTFLTMNSQNFQEIFSTTIDYLVDKLSKNPALQVVFNAFLANPSTSPLFAMVLVEYCLERLEEMGSNSERSSLYLRLFKLVFGSVTLFPSGNEYMLRPHLHTILKRSIELSMTAKEPYNYFLLLRALFRSIGGGSHDLLYQEFLPLLPRLLESLNELQSGFHKQHMKDIFVELCLTVPVRLSSLLPYLPKLMDPLVSALNGSPTLVNQGLRTLELCVDNLQPDFLYDHIQPVRADLMHGLWRTLHNQENTGFALVAFRVLGKLGGGNRKMLIEPQKLEYTGKNMCSTAIVVHFDGYTKPIHFLLNKVIEMAFNALNSNTTELFYRKQSWEIIRCFLAASINCKDEKHTLYNYFLHPTFTEGPIQTLSAYQYKSQNNQVRQIHQTALTGMLIAAATKELHETVFPVMIAAVRHYTMVAIAQQAGPFAYKPYNSSIGIDPLVLVDAVAACMGHEEKELCKSGLFCIGLILKTATNIVGTKERAACLPLMQYLAERLSGLCYEKSWYGKLGGCNALKYLYQHMPVRYLYQNLFIFVKAFMFVIMDLSDEISSGTIEVAKLYLENMLRICMIPLDKNFNSEELIQIQNKAMCDVIQELVRQITNPYTALRLHAISSLKLIAELQGKTVYEIMDPHREVLADIIPPKKHLLRHQSLNAQIGLMDGYTFCTTLEPKLFALDLSNNYHKVFFHELLTLSEAEDNTLRKLDCYKDIYDLAPLRKSALNALASCNYIAENNLKERIMQIMFKVLEQNSAELQEAAFECMQKFISGVKVDQEIIHAGIRPLIHAMNDHKNLTLSNIKQLSYITQLFPSMFAEKFCEQLLQIIQQMLEISIQNHRTPGHEANNFLAVSKSGCHEKKVLILIEIFQYLPTASSKFVETLCQLVLQTERNLMIEQSSPYRESLTTFLVKHPRKTVNLFLSDENMLNTQWNRFLIYLLKHKNGLPFRNVIQTEMVPHLIQLIQNNTQQMALFASDQQHYETLHQAILIIHTLMELDEQWLPTQIDIVNALKLLWQNNLYVTSEKNIVCDLWHLVAKILLFYFSHNTNDIDLLFQLIRALCLYFVPDFNFLRDFLQTTVAQSYTVDWKRKAFFYFVENFNNPNMPQNLKAKILTTILIPCFAISFDKGEGNKLIGTSPAPYQEDDNNIVSVFITKIFDPDKPFANDDIVRIAILQFACLLVERASPHIHDGDANNKSQGNKLRRLMTFAWTSLINKNCFDPTARYHGHLLLSHIIARLAIHKKIVLQVFHSLLKGHSLEARPVVRQALDILTPALPLRMVDGKMLTHWTKKIIIEEGHATQQLFHILQLIVRHYKVYYPVRHDLIQHLINYMQRLAYPVTSSLDYRKLTVELAEVIIKWEMQRIKEEKNGEFDYDESLNDDIKNSSNGGVKRLLNNESNDTNKKFSNDEHNAEKPVLGEQKVEGANQPIDKIHCDTVLNFLIRIACHVNDNTQITPGMMSPAENLSRKCIMLLKMTMKPEVWAPPYDLKLNWMDKLLLGIQFPQSNYGSIYVSLEILTFLTTILTKQQILEIIRELQCGLSACVNCQNTRVIRLMHALLSRLMNIFPPDANHRCEELDTLYSTVSKMIQDGLTSYEKNPQSGPSQLFGTLMILKACCLNNQSYIDRLMMPFIRLLSRLTKEHLNSCNVNLNTGNPGEGNSLALELLILSLDLVKNRVLVMGTEVRKLFIGNILVSLIEKSSEVKIIKAIIRIIEDWMKNTNQPQTPTLREKSILLVKLMHYVEKRFSDEQDLTAQYLELINFIYRDEVFKRTELTSKLEAAFLFGLCYPQIQIREKFIEIFDETIPRRLHDRLFYIICSKAWDSLGPHYWIKQCIEFLMLTANKTTQIQISNQNHLVPSILSVMNNIDGEEKKNFMLYASIKNEICTESLESAEDKEDILNLDASIDSMMHQQQENESPIGNRLAIITKLINQQMEFIEENRKISTDKFLKATVQLSHSNATLTEQVWIDTFPRIWSILDANEQEYIAPEIIQFISSGTHIVQKNLYRPSALNTFVEALCHCDPPIYIPPSIMIYLGKTHNLWHRMTLMLENMAEDWPTKKYKYQSIGEQYPVEENESIILDSLSNLYSELQEEDLWGGLWLKYAKYSETNMAIAYEQMGYFEEAQGLYDLVMSKYKTDRTSNYLEFDITSEVQLWESHWIKCTKELNQWDILLDYAQTYKNNNSSFLIMSSAWRIQNWNLMKKAIKKIEQANPKLESYKINMYKGLLAMLNQEQQQQGNFERYIELASIVCMEEWRRLPHIVSHMHIPYLQATNQIIELQEASQIHTGLLQGRNSSLHDIKAIIKTWRNRLPIISDDLSHWSDILTCRQHHYQLVTQHLETIKQEQGSNIPMLGVRASVQAIITFGKIARKHNLISVCQESLSRIYTIPSVPIIDCFQKIRQQIKCYLQMASVSDRNELNEALQVIVSTNLKYFSNEMIAEFHALKGQLLALIGRSEEANKAFIDAIQQHEGLAKAWALWGEYLEQIFIKNPQQINFGVSTITCFLHACRHQNESKTRKYLAKVLWLLSYDNAQLSLVNTLEKYSVGVPPLHWLPWIPQLLCCLLQYDSQAILNLLSQVGRVFTQAVYFPIRTLYLTLKLEQREKYRNVEQTLLANKEQNSQVPDVQQQAFSTTNQQQTSTAPTSSTPMTTAPIKATPQMWRCSKVMHIQREIHPTILTSLEGIVNQMIWFRENWYEEVLRQLRQGLIKCRAIAFENRNAVNEATVTPHTLHFINKLVETFGVGIENISNSAASTFLSTSDSSTKRTQNLGQDPMLQKMKGQFTADFDFSQPGSLKLQNLINKLKKWIKILEAKTKLLPKSFLIEEKCRFLSNFNQKVADVDLPGEVLLSGQSHYHIRIARFMPRVEIVQKHNTAARLLYIRGTNGRIYPYLVISDSGVDDSRKEERVLQLLRMLNHYLTKQKETSRRFLRITVPRVIPISPQMRLVEDNLSSMSLFEIYKDRCNKKLIEHDSPITLYYKRLAEVQKRGVQVSVEVLRDILDHVQLTMIPKTLLKDWALRIYRSATDYWQFRKMITLQTSLLCLCEYVFHLTRLNADMMYIHQDTGMLHASYFKFDIDESTGDFDVNRPVPFRLTSNIVEFMSSNGLVGPLTVSSIVAARCFIYPNFKLSTILKAILKTEIIAIQKKQLKSNKSIESIDVSQQDATVSVDMENIIKLVNNAVSEIMSRLNNISYFDNVNTNQMATLVRNATDPNNLCKMDPTWHPWF